MPIINLEEFLNFCNEHQNEKEKIATEFIEFSERNEEEAIKFLNLPESYYFIDLNKYPDIINEISSEKVQNYLPSRLSYQKLKLRFKLAKIISANVTDNPIEETFKPFIKEIVRKTGCNYIIKNSKEEKFESFIKETVRPTGCNYIENPVERIFWFVTYHPHYFSNEHKDKIKSVVNIEDFNLPEEIYYFIRNLIILSEIFEKNLLNIYFNAAFEEILSDEINFNNYFDSTNPKANFLEILNAYEEKHDKNLDNWHAYTYASLLYSKQIPNNVKIEKNYEKTINRLQILFKNEQKEVNNEQNNVQNVPPLEFEQEKDISCLIA